MYFFFSVVIIIVIEIINKIFKDLLIVVDMVLELVLLKYCKDI